MICQLISKTSVPNPCQGVGSQATAISAHDHPQECRCQTATPDSQPTNGRDVAQDLPYFRRGFQPIAP